jgi:acetylornithine/N-succinyldiaminopimelate aminotransferase
VLTSPGGVRILAAFSRERAMISPVMPTYGQPDLALERGEGAYLYDTGGRRYLDFGSGIAVTALGHCHPHLVAALRDQAAKLWHTSNLFRIPGQVRLAERLVAASFADTVFFCNSGVEAVECGIKLIRKYHDETGNPNRWRIITCQGAFHGRTLTAISAAGNPAHLKGFLPEVPGFDHVAFNNLNELRAAITDETAAILVEPVQGESGIRPADDGFLAGLRAICDEFGLLLFLDEIQTGMGRTGKLFAYQWGDAAPDVLAAAKGLGGGFPVGACLASERAAVGMTTGAHGSTFGGNPLAMAAANAVLDVVLEDGFLEHVRRVAKVLRAGLVDLAARHRAVIESVRGAGLLLGLKCAVPNTEMIARLRAEGLITVAAGDNVVRVLPPLIIDERHVDEALAILERVCGAWARAA